MARNGMKKDRDIACIEDLLRAHFPDYPPQYPPRAYRLSPAAIRIRVVSPSFRGIDSLDRDDLVVPILKNNLAHETWLDVMNILLLTPEEVAESFANREFENPTNSRL